MGFLDKFKKGPETVADLKEKQDVLQAKFEEDQLAAVKAKSRLVDSKTALVDYNKQFGQVLRLVEGDK